jgi:hypothetical protein
VVVVSVDGAVVSAHAVAVSTPSARRGAPAQIVTVLNTVFFIGVSFTLTPRMALSVGAETWLASTILKAYRGVAGSS